MKQHFDVTIVGAGIVGAALALTLAKSSFKVALIETAPNEVIQRKSQNSQAIVLAHTSRIVLETLGIWVDLEKESFPIRAIHVSDKGLFGAARIQAEEENVPALGYVVSAGHITKTLHEAMKTFPSISLLQPAEFSKCEYMNSSMNVTLLHQGKECDHTSDLLVAADGQRSAISRYHKIQTSARDYDQVAIFCEINLKRSHEGVAYEHFTLEGPLAILPFTEKSAGVIWTVSKERASHLLTMTERTFLATLQEQFGYRLGKFIHCGPRFSTHLQLSTAKHQIKPGLVLLGNAAHTLHPVAGQGLNLAIRDFAVLAEELLSARKKGDSLGDIKVLQKYLSRRTEDQNRTIGLTHLMVGLFSNPLLSHVLARMTSMFCVDKLQWAKKILTRSTLGLTGKMPRLACGLTLED